MKRLCILGALAVLPLVAADGDDPKAELKKLEGDWQLTLQEERGFRTPKPVVERLRVVVGQAKATGFEQTAIGMVRTIDGATVLLIGVPADEATARKDMLDIAKLAHFEP